MCLQPPFSSRTAAGGRAVSGRGWGKGGRERRGDVDDRQEWRGRDGGEVPGPVKALEGKAAPGGTEAHASHRRPRLASKMGGRPRSREDPNLTFPCSLSRNTSLPPLPLTTTIALPRCHSRPVPVRPVRGRRRRRTHAARIQRPRANSAASPGTRSDADRGAGTPPPLQVHQILCIRANSWRSRAAPTVAVGTGIRRRWQWGGASPLPDRTWCCCRSHRRHGPAATGRPTNSGRTALASLNGGHIALCADPFHARPPTSPPPARSYLQSSPFLSVASPTTRLG